MPSIVGPDINVSFNSDKGDIGHNPGPTLPQNGFAYPDDRAPVCTFARRTRQPMSRAAR
ncbi:hypothetical protein NBRGN_065_00860 [Nocardia brasiliensis NBRC 14402]|nr:hypothetical protein NBRGN_065_00860 [Nocardia brasiliensis NBRC 14402]